MARRLHARRRRLALTLREFVSESGSCPLVIVGLRSMHLALSACAHAWTASPACQTVTASHSMRRGIDNYHADPRFNVFPSYLQWLRVSAAVTHAVTSAIVHTEYSYSLLVHATTV